MIKHLKEKVCIWFKQYKAVYKPKCDCKPCHDKFEQTKTIKRPQENFYHGGDMYW